MKKLIFILSFAFYSCNVFSLENIKFIVNTNSSVNSVTQNQIRDFFLKRARNWPDGTPLRFFDRSDDSPERQFFLKNYIKRTSRQVEQHWIGQKLYSGDSSPSQVPTDSLVASLVARFPGGISYVSDNFTEANGVKIIEVVGE